MNDHGPVLPGTIFLPLNIEENRGGRREASRRVIKIYGMARGGSLTSSKITEGEKWHSERYYDVLFFQKEEGYSTDSFSLIL
jgi:hypothetical protein